MFDFDKLRKYSGLCEARTNEDVRIVQVRKESVPTKMKDLKKWNVYAGEVLIGYIFCKKKYIKVKKQKEYVTSGVWEYNVKWNVDAVRSLLDIGSEVNLDELNDHKRYFNILNDFVGELTTYSKKYGKKMAFVSKGK